MDPETLSLILIGLVLTFLLIIFVLFLSAYLLLNRHGNGFSDPERDVADALPDKTSESANKRRKPLPYLPNKGQDNQLHSWNEA
jgi:hypothetical protein